MLITSEPIDTRRQVEKVVDSYRARWTIEEFFKALKTGCAFEKRQLESYAALRNTVHHVRFRSRGGDDAPENLTSLCAAHHLHAVHRGWIRVAGRGPHALRWGFRGGAVLGVEAA